MIQPISSSRGRSEAISHSEAIESIQLPAETEGIFTESGGGVTLGCARKLYQQGRIAPDETTVLCITRNGLKTTDALAGKYETEAAIPPKLLEFEKYLQNTLEVPETVEV